MGFLDTFMADFQSVEGASLWSSVGGKSTLLGDWPLKDFSKCAASMLCSDYKVEDKDILFTTAFALSAGVPVTDPLDVNTSMARLRQDLYRSADGVLPGHRLQCAWWRQCQGC